MKRTAESLARSEGHNAQRRQVGGYRWREEWEDVQERNTEIKRLLVDACHRSSSNREVSDLLVKALDKHVDNMLTHASLSTYGKGTR